MLGFDAKHRLPSELLVKRLQGGLRAEDEVGGVFDLHQAPMIGVREHVEHWAALCGIAVQDVMQGVQREGIGERLGARPVIDFGECIVGHREADTGRSQSPRQPVMAIAVELQPERTPSRHPQIDQSQLGVHKVEVIVQTLATVRAKESLMRPFVVPGLVGIARFHCRDDVHQTGMIATRRQDFGDDSLLADMGLGDVLDRYPCGRRDRCRRRAHPITQFRRKRRIIEDPYPPPPKQLCHPLGKAHPRQGPRDHDPVVARQDTRQPISIPIRQKWRHAPPPALAYGRRILPCLVPALPA